MKFVPLFADEKDKGESLLRTNLKEAANEPGRLWLPSSEARQPHPRSDKKGAHKGNS